MNNKKKRLMAALSFKWDNLYIESDNSNKFLFQELSSILNDLKSGNLIGYFKQIFLLTLMLQGHDEVRSKYLLSINKM